VAKATSSVLGSRVHGPGRARSAPGDARRRSCLRLLAGTQHGCAVRYAARRGSVRCCTARRVTGVRPSAARPS